MKLIDEFDISDRVKLRFQVGEYQSEERIDLRQSVLVDKDYIPTKKGINFNFEWIDRFIVMIDKLKDL